MWDRGKEWREGTGGGSGILSYLDMNDQDRKVTVQPKHWRSNCLQGMARPLVADALGSSRAY
jgi:hypothetical protein